MGDGDSMYAQPANTGAASSGSHPYLVSAENDGVNWKPYNTQTFTNGPHLMAFDPVNRIIYSANDCAGVWALKSSHPAAAIAPLRPKLETVSASSGRHMILSGMPGPLSMVNGPVFDIRGRRMNGNGTGVQAAVILR
jgi:hypothetical protein